MNNWTAQDQTNATLIGDIEFQSNDQEYHHFTIVKNDTHFIFGGCCNTGLLESGNFKLDDCFSTDENLQELTANLESYYNDGKGYQSDSFTCNDRM